MSSEHISSRDLEHALNPQAKDFASTVRLTPATLAVHRTKGAWIPAPHLLYISALLAVELAKGNAFVVVALPVRHGKSELISIHTPIWWLDQFPHTNVILTTYGADLSEGFCRRVRDEIKEDPSLQVKVHPSVQRVDHFATTEGGGMTGVGIGGPIIGKGTHLLIVDDYIKNLQEAQSSGRLAYIWDWFTTTAYTRVEPGGNIVVLANRWEVNDLIGMIKRNKGLFPERVTVIELPALAEHNDPLGRKPGEALWPERYSRASLEAKRKILGTYFNAMYQQQPIAREDAEVAIDQITCIDVLPAPHLLRWTRSWDLAASESKKSDFTVGALLGTEKSSWLLKPTYLADLVRGQWSSDKVERTILNTAHRDGRSIPITIEQEPGAAGKLYVEYLAKKVLKDYQVEITPNTGRSKWTKAQPLLASISGGLFHMKRAVWNSVVTLELKAFGTETEHDDTVDSCATGYNRLHTGLLAGVTWGRILPKGGGPASSNLDVLSEQEKVINSLSVRRATFGR